MPAPTTTPPTPAVNPRLHRLTADGDRVACGARFVYAVRYQPYAVAYLSRHPDTVPCARCWPEIARP